MIKKRSAKKPTKTQRRRELRERAMAAKLREAQASPSAMAAAPAAYPETGGRGAAPDERVQAAQTPPNATESPEPRSVARIEQRAVARGWVSTATPERLAAVLSRQMVIALSQNPRDASRAAAVVTKVVGQIMEQEKRDAGIIDNADFPPAAAAAQVNIQINNGQPVTIPEPEGIAIVQRADFYRNDAHQRQAAAEPPQAAEPSVAGSPVAEAV